MDLKASVCLCLMLKVFATSAFYTTENYKDKYEGSGEVHEDYTTPQWTNGDKYYGEIPIASYPDHGEPTMTEAVGAVTVIHLSHLINLVEKSYECHTCKNRNNDRRDDYDLHPDYVECAEPCNSYARQLMTIFNTMISKSY